VNGPHVTYGSEEFNTGVQFAQPSKPIPSISLNMCFGIIYLVARLNLFQYDSVLYSNITLVEIGAYAAMRSPFAALLFDYKDLGLSQKTEFRFQKHHLFPILMTWAVFLCYRFVYFWVLGAWALFYLLVSGELKRILTGSYRFLKPDRSDMSELEEIYSE
jgi:hypothetical protein